MQTKLYSTYARLFIAFNPELSRLMSDAASESHSTDPKLLDLNVPSEVEVKQVLFHPQNKSLRDLIATAYSDSVRVSQKINSALNSLSTQHDYVKEALYDLEERKREAEKESPALAEELNKKSKALNEQFKLLKTPDGHIKNSIDHCQKELNQINQDLASVAQKQDKEWADYRGRLLDELRDEIQVIANDNNLHIVPGEIENLLRQDLQEVVDRFQEFGAYKNLPADVSKILALGTPDFDTFFKMKAFLAFRSMLPSSEGMGTLMQKLTKFFDHAKKEGADLHSKHLEEIAPIEQRIQPVLTVATDNNKMLANLDSGRENLLSEKDRASIEKRLEFGAVAKPPVEKPAVEPAPKEDQKLTK